MDKHKVPDFIGDCSDPGPGSLRGTHNAKALVTMTIASDLIAEPELQPALSCNWVETHADYLFNFAIGQVRDPSVAEDIVQETFLAAVRARETFSGQSSERTWLTGILRHKIYDHLRKSCRERAFRQHSDAPPDMESWDEAAVWLHEVAAESQSPSRRIELQEFRQNLELALGKLPPRIAQVFQLYEIEDCANREVCERLNISETNLWVMLHRARKQLRAELGDWWFGKQPRRPSN